MNNTKPPFGLDSSPGLREVILNAESIEEVDACEHEATSYKYASRKTRNGIRNAAAKRRKELAK